ncbi:hypothetical protein K491DRAFT_693563 [Lophiostoma macrostomum CBS 122681]|uniref:Uncharacterized protein n=1 Tax=Lophiostoma macrostomum CBS 122681 TaxID=1314788 RepID=A0A6A6T7E9_9PLEO|nr:hypothetical protein K491DRAFT_693563 [Lophiostoma macrostomum CBS 122681]
MSPHEKYCGRYVPPAIDYRQYNRGPEGEQYVYYNGPPPYHYCDPFDMHYTHTTTQAPSYSHPPEISETDVLLLPTHMTKLSISYKRLGHSMRRMTATATRDLKLRNVVRQIVGDGAHTKQVRLLVKFRNEWREPGWEMRVGALERAGGVGKVVEMRIEGMDGGKWMCY